MVMIHWLKCKIGVGQFTGEFAVSGVEFNGKGFSLFVPEDVLEFDGDPVGDETVNGWLQVAVTGQQDQLLLVRLPRQTLENGQSITVNQSQVETRERCQEA